MTGFILKLFKINLWISFISLSVQDILKNTLIFFYLGKFYQGLFFSSRELFLEFWVINPTLYEAAVISFWCLYSGFRNIWTIISNGLYYLWY